MAIPSDLLPISAVLQLGGIAGAGAGIAQRKAQQIQDQQLAQQRIAQQIQAEQQQRQQEAAGQANAIQTALSYDKLNQDQQQFQAQQATEQSKLAAQNLLDTSHQAENTRQFNERNAVDVNQQNLQQQKFDTEQTQKTDQEQSVNDMISKLGVPKDEQDRLRLQFKATGRLPAPAGESDARNLNALTIARKTLLDPYGEPQPGKEADLAAIDQQIASIVKSVGGAPAAPAASAPAGVAQPTGQKTPEGVPLARALTGETLPAPTSPAEYQKLPRGVRYIDPNSGLPATKQR